MKKKIIKDTLTIVVALMMIDVIEKGYFDLKGMLIRVVTCTAVCAIFRFIELKRKKKK